MLEPHKFVEGVASNVGINAALAEVFIASGAEIILFVVWGSASGTLEFKFTVASGMVFVPLGVLL
jgi:hypothetical protein